MDEGRRRREQNRQALLASREPERQSCVCLAGSAVSDRDDVVARGDVLAAGEFQRQRLVERGDGGEVESVEALHRGKARGANAALDRAAFAVDQFEFDEAQQIADMIVSVARSLDRDLLVFPQHRRQLELTQVMGKQHARRSGRPGGGRHDHAAVPARSER